MAIPSDEVQLKSAFFHSINKVMVLDSQMSSESIYKSSHVIKINDILGVNLPYYTEESDIDQWIIDNPGVIEKHDMQNITQVPGSNSQSWYIDIGGIWKKPIVLSSLVSDETNTPAFGYIFELYDNNDRRIGEGEGKWWVDPYQGIIHFDKGYTPLDLGYGTPKVSCYVFIGESLSDVLDDHQNQITTHTHQEVNTHRITVNDGTEPTEIKSYDIWIEVDPA